ncbi:MAG: S41 family peptidase [Sphaerochaeta sp.]|uniref:S41 family peptidase n=1 Tax=Sphaerochaeta sp. TaxID=1972642 RepID=UPI003D0DD3C6
MRRTLLRRLSLSFITLLIFLPVFAGGSVEQLLASGLPSSTQTDKIATDMASLTSLYRYVDSIYIDEVDKQKMFDDLASALIASLDDPYSFYVPPSEAKQYQEDTTGMYGGIGTYLNKPSPDSKDPADPASYMITIISPFPGSPAQRAGLMAGDLISHIDGEKVDDLTSYEASMKLRGEPNTPVTITVYRKGTSFDLTLNREPITTPTVDSAVIEGNIGYIILSEFTPQTGSQLLEHVQKLMKQNITGLIIDERNNSGGAVDGAMQSANIFLKDGQTLVTIQGKKGTNRDQRYVATGNTVVPQTLPIVILANGGSASSSEIFAAAMKDNGRATLIGTKTFGKGIVQDVFKFGDGFAQVTTAHYYTPKGENIHKKGIEPDIQVDDAQIRDEEIPAYEQLMTDKVISTYVQEHPDATDQNIIAFAEENKDRGINADALKLLVRNEYLSKIPYDQRPIADPTFDNQLKRAVQFIQEGK